jgi:hypothetical protein
VSNWNELTPEEKRQQRLRKWLPAEEIVFPSTQAKTSYQARVKRFIDAIDLTESDRVLCMLPDGNFPAYYGLDTIPLCMIMNRLRKPGLTLCMNSIAILPRE